MSLQSVLDYNVGTEEGRFLKNVAIKGESGDLVVPENVHVRLYDCTIGNLTLNDKTGKNGIFIEGGTCKDINAKSTNFKARGTQFNGSGLFDEGSDLDLYSCKVVKPWNLLKKSFIRVDDTGFQDSDIALKLETGSSARATRCTFQGHATSAIKAMSKSYAYLARCSFVKASEAALWAMEESVIEGVECPLVEGIGTDGIRVETSGRIELLNCTTVKGAVRAGNGKTKGFISLHKCQNILGVGAQAILLDSEARADIRNFQSFKGQGDSALKCISKNYAYVAIGLELKSDAKDAIELDGTSSAEVVSVGNVKGQGRHGASAIGASKVTLMRCQTVTGQGADGVHLEGASRASLGDIDDLSGQGGHGISGVGNSRVDTHTVKNITGQGGHGINLDGSKAIVKNSTKLEGVAGHGAALASASSILVHGTPDVTGTAGDGINADGSSSVHVASCTNVKGASGNGISVTGGGNLHVSDVSNVQGASGDGIHTEGAEVKLARIAAIQGSQNGVSSSGNGAGSTLVTITDCPSTQGGSTGYSFENVKAITRGGAIQGGTALSLTNSHLETSNDSFSGDATGSDSVLAVRESTISGSVSWTNVAIIDQKGSHGASLTMSAVGAVMASTTLPTNSSDSSGLVGANATLGDTSTSGGGVMLSGGSGIVKGDGAAVSLNAGRPEDGVDYVALNSGVTVMQDQIGSFLHADNDEVKLSSIDGSTITLTESVATVAVTEYSEEAGTSISESAGTEISESTITKSTTATTITTTAATITTTAASIMTTAASQIMTGIVNVIGTLQINGIVVIAP